MVAKDKERLLITISKEDKAKLQELAKDDNRSLANFISTIIKDYLKSHSK